MRTGWWRRFPWRPRARDGTGRGGEGVVAGFGAGDERAGGRAQGGDVAQMVGVGVVERARCAHFIRKET